jgi:tRNA dimethylallyltransferase
LKAPPAAGFVAENSLSYNKIIVICGPTGVGKTGFAIALARRLNGEIVGADSMQIYRCMDIGTAKPTAAEQAAVPHHMVDIIDPDQAFDAAEYGRRAEVCVARLIQRGKLPLVVGGTGLYIKALIYGLTGTAPADQKVRAALKHELAQSGARSMYDRLCRVDPRTARRLHPNDTFRVLRAMEVFRITGQPISAHHDDHRFRQPRFSVLQIGLTLPRPLLYARIDQRVDAMLDKGLVEEVRALLDKGLDPRLKSMQSLGYRHMTDYLQGRLTWEEAVRTLKRDHRRYAKRQLTWFSTIGQVRWLPPDQHAQALSLIEGFLPRQGG